MDSDDTGNSSNQPVHEDKTFRRVVKNGYNGDNTTNEEGKDKLDEDSDVDLENLYGFELLDYKDPLGADTIETATSLSNLSHGGNAAPTYDSKNLMRIPSRASSTGSGDQAPKGVTGLLNKLQNNEDHIDEEPWVELGE